MKKNIFLGVLIVIIFGLCGYIFYDKSNPNNNKENQVENENNVTNNNVVYTYSDIKGLYETMLSLDIDGEKLDVYYSLYLWENGTFKYQYSAQAPFGVMGNYVIDGDKIILNYLFKTNSGASIEVTAGTKTLSINSDNSLIDYDYQFKSNDIDSIKLEKANSVDENTYLQTYDFNKILNSYEILNNSSDNIN